ncbi:DUF4225 domain-containing protein [Pseudomonas sp. CCC3.2]|uniref:DUF4225 domain-containing protein n=1 Tax=unclassified Pseudomonas TaxID=196821 RepID=UPI002AB3B4DD|nr:MULTISPECIES: DUF4225 domain-containing protein [unclassified Pseudomonas]MDY7559114.1 DUF4225 domain-containing protein [Pseudomonas sp. AB6]MEB0179904.1 DUF4225 domain-containing protein [Pseudomonas sp. CCC3.2]MEB0209182.1 DUF4225 domain-containing protein [Pseudomonas sp. AB6]
MEQINGKQKPSSDDYFRVTNAASVLASQACTVSAKHIQDGMLRLQFNRKVAYYARGIVRDVAEGKKSPERGLKELTVELKALAIKSVEIGQKSVGVVAGVSQMVGGAAICTGVITCPIGATIIAHGTNNIIENSVNLWTGDSNMQGPVRKVYRYIAKNMIGTDATGDKAYAIIDLSLSGWGLIRKVQKPETWKLFRTMPTDLFRAYRLMNKPSLALEILSDSMTIRQLYQLNDQ